ncbi:MAG: gamma-glutamylcyclotransferase family protein [Pseudomonadota bacterium]
MLIAVYGTLKSGMINHKLLEEARLLGTDFLDGIALYDLGDFPAARLEPSDGILVEVYEITDKELAVLDVLEECNHDKPEQGLYKRVQYSTGFGWAWIYLYNGQVEGLRRVTKGGWWPAYSLVTTF